MNNMVYNNTDSIDRGTISSRGIKNISNLYDPVSHWCWPVLKLGQFAMSETCENWLGFVNSYVYYTH